MKRLKYFALAALVAFAACDEGNEVVAPATGSISGVVTVDGSALAGVTVTLSSGQTATTDASGSYVFSDVDVGAYTVTISGMPSDAAFGTTSQAAVITTAGQVVTLNFQGSFITTSAISATVSVPGVGGLSGATVAISGPSTASQVTPASGTVTFSGLRAGSYTVTATLSSGDAALYDLDNPSVNVDLDVDELEAVAFTATPKTISSISGRMYIDEATKNNQFDAGNEDNLTIADVDVIIEGVSVGVFDTIQTDANGEFQLTGLPAANYRITLDTSPFNGAVALGTPNDIVITLGVADGEVVNFGFDIIEQQVVVGAFLGFDEDEGSPSRVNPLAGVDIDLYPTQLAATNETNSFGDGDTGSSGLLTLSFDRADDTDPFGGVTDRVVFARVTDPGGSLTRSGEEIIEIPFEAKDSITTALDVFDYLNTDVTVSVRVQEIDEDRYADLQVENATDTTVAGTTDLTDGDGLVYFDLTALDEHFFTFDDTQPNLPNAGVGLPNWPSPFTLTLDEDQGMADGSWLSYDNIGTAIPGDTVFIGTVNISWDLVDSRGRMHREINDEGDIPTWQPDEELDFAGPNISAFVNLQQNVGGVWTTLGVGDQQPNAVNGIFQNNGIESGEMFRYVAQTFNQGRAVLNDTILEFTPDGSDQVVELCPLRDEAGTFFATCSTFAMKFQNNTISGSVLYRDGTPAPDGTEVTITATADNIQGRASTAGDTIVEVDGGAGAFTTNATVREGPYEVAPVEDGDIVFFDNVNGAAKTVDVQGAAVDAAVPTATPARSSLAGGPSPAASFHGYATTSIAGAIINDRDQDGNTIDTDEALIGVTVNLYKDDTSGFTVTEDSLVATAVTGTDGSYTFEDLLEGRYRLTVESAPADAVVLNADGEDRLDFVTEAGDPDKGDASPTPLPFWDYQNSDVVNPGTVDATSTPAGEQFTFLFTNGTARGTVSGTGGAAVTVTIIRCLIETDDPLTMPAAGTCDTDESGTFSNFITGSDGVYEFSDLREGIYEIEVVEESIGLTTGGDPVLVFVDGNGDLEVANFTIS